MQTRSALQMCYFKVVGCDAHIVYEYPARRRWLPLCNAPSRARVDRPPQALVSGVIGSVSSDARSSSPATTHGRTLESVGDLEAEGGGAC